MSKLSKKFLISGCGISWSGQEKKTWVNIFRAAGLKITDVGGPAVSNQWILNKVIIELWDSYYDTVIIQLTSLGKLDVEVDSKRTNELVNNDSIRNFTYKGVWPSSTSDDHDSKKLYYKWLFSPKLEIEDIVCKLLLLSILCKQKNTKLYVYQGYEILWSDAQQKLLDNIITDSTILYDEYLNSKHYEFHDHMNTVPGISYQFSLAKMIAYRCCPEIIERINKMFDKSANVVLT